MKLFELKSPAELTELENQLDKLFYSLGLDVEFTTHFKERILGRERQVTIEEVIHSFELLKRKYKRKLINAKKEPHYTAVLRDFDQDLNFVFGIKQTKDGPELVNITIKQKDPSTFIATSGDELEVGQRRVREDSIPAVMSSGLNPLQTADDHDEKSVGQDTVNNHREHILSKHSRGKNHKIAKRIASKARFDAKATDAEQDDNPNQPYHGGYSPDNFRLR